jgi:hypothetical protein
MQNAKIKVQTDRATVNKKLKFKKQRTSEDISIFEFCVLIFDL